MTVDMDPESGSESMGQGTGNEVKLHIFVHSVFCNFITKNLLRIRIELKYWIRIRIQSIRIRIDSIRIYNPENYTGIF
jgi:hypothetical protein